MNTKYIVILSKVDWCGHCKNFLPFFNESQNLIKNNENLKDVNLNFEIFEMTEEEKKEEFKKKYPELNVDSFPTVFLAKSIDNKITNIIEVGHDNNTGAFIERISNAYLKLSKIGGYNDEYYKLKYLKYKAKYLQYKV
jgi:thiol-disulfide isomerase/thioredoxin